ncbi:hypothetical protein BD410DRAFT_781908 [Rickenella mellea]|uniref:Clp1-like protein n=1 Tax=Rickenella mellea TaxID=50990 RepID=A0A4Y7QKN7_9AGAM|nr:hypothetical protein BD410DRAFT_781908 [Rickenella mellea]
MDAIVSDVSGSMPTHMMAVYSRPEAGEKCKVMVYPIHSIVLAAHCANLSALPPSKPNAPETPGAPVTIPVVPLCLPHAESFPILSTYLYSKRPTNLLSALLPPAPRDPNQQPIDKTSAASMTRALRERAVAIGSAHSPNVLVERCAHVSGLWHNVCALGVYDDVLWRTMDVAWETLLVALGVSVRGARALVERS